MKNEKLTTVLVTLIFTITLAFAWIYFRDYYSHMAVVGGAILSIAHLASFVGSLIKFDDPDFDWLRKVSILTAIAASIVILTSGSQNKVGQEERAAAAQQAIEATK